MGDDLKYAAPASKNGFEIAILCALPKERAAVLLLLDDLWDGKGSNRHRYARAEGDFNTYTHGRIGRFNVVIVLLDTMGKVPAAGAATAVRIGYPNISLALIVGICAGVPFPKKSQEITLGDIVISNILIHCDFGRQYSDRFTAKVQVEDVYGRPHKNIRSLLRSLGDDSRPEVEEQAAEYLRQLQEKNDMDPKRETGKYTYPGVDKDKLFADDYEHKHHGHHDPTLDCGRCTQGSICEGSREIECDELRCDDEKLVPRQRLTQHRAQGSSPLPQIHIGRMGSGDSVIRSAQHRNALAAKGVIGIEMEGAGVWDELPCIVVKGVCDYADSHKGKGWQDYAAATAASVAKAVLDEYPGSGRVVENASEHQAILTPAPFLNAPFQPDDDFVERDEIMSWLQTELGSKPEGCRAALVGFGGVGKSRLVIRYARNTQIDSPQTHVLWVYAGTQALFIGSFREIAQELSLDGWDDVKVDVLRLVLDWLRSGNRQWLIILDNADDINVFDPKPDERKDSDSGAASSTALKPLDFLRRCQNGNILITSRSEKVVRRLGVGLHFRRVEPMIKGQARQLLRHKLATVEDESEEENLVDALDCIPLAITQAAAYINHLASTGRTSVRVYLEQFRESENNQAVLLNHLPKDEASGPVFTTWIITYDHIRKERPSASDLLSLLSFFYHRGIPEWVLERYYKNFETYHPHAKLPQDCLDPLAEDVATLCSYSLVTVVPVTDNQDSRQVSSRSLQMHALVHTCTRHWLRSNNVDQQWLSTVTELLETAHPSPPKHDTWAKCAEISPHVDSLLTFPGLEQLDEPLTAKLVYLLSSAVWYNIAIGALGRAESLVLKPLDVAEKRLCNPHSETYWVLRGLDTLSSYNTALRTRLESSANRYCAGLINSLTTPSEQFGALSAYMQPNSSATVEITDSHKHAEEHKRVIMSIQDMQSSGFNNPTVLEIGHLERFILNAPFCHSTEHAFKVIRDITKALNLLKRYEDLEIIYRALLKRQTCFTERDWDIWDLIYWCKDPEETKERLCEVLTNQGKYEEAEDLLRTLIVPRGDLDDHYGHYLQLGKLLLKQKRFEEAEKVFREALDLLYTSDGSDKDLTLQVYTKKGLWYNGWLGNALAQQGKHAEAVVFFRQILEWSQQLQPQENPDTLRTYKDLAESLECLGEYEEAESLLKHCVEVCERKFSHDMLSDYLVALLENLKSQGREGEEEYEKFENRLSELGYELVSSDDDDSCEEWETCSGSELSLDENQADIESGQSGKAQSDYLNVDSTSGPSQPSEMAQTINTSDPDPFPNGMDSARQENECHKPQNVETFRDTAHSVRPNIGRSASEDSDSSDDVRTASRVNEQLKGRLEGRENTSRPGMNKFFAIGLGKRRSLCAERALEDCMRLLKEVEKEAGEELDKDRNVVRGDEDEVEEDVE